jgi:hypothetical protein
MTDFPRYDRDSLYNYIYFVLEAELSNSGRLDHLTDRISEAVTKWVPKKGDFWLNEDDGMLYINKGWEVVTSKVAE